MRRRQEPSRFRSYWTPFTPVTTVTATTTQPGTMVPTPTKTMSRSGSTDAMAKQLRPSTASSSGTISNGSQCPTDNSPRHTDALSSKSASTISPVSVACQQLNKQLVTSEARDDFLRTAMSSRPKSSPLVPGNSHHKTSKSSKSTASGDGSPRKKLSLQERRLALGQQRADLERRLFSSKSSTTTTISSSAVASSSIDATSLSTTASASSDLPDQSTPSSERTYTVNGEVVRWSSLAVPASLEMPQQKKSQLKPPKSSRKKVNKNTDTVDPTDSTSSSPLPSGSGRMVFPDGQIYDGFCRDGLRHGQGHNAWSDGQIYTGNWHDGHRHGRGTHTWPDGQVYTGDWKGGQRHGRGTHTWPDGRTVTGAWQNGHMHGRIFFAWPDGARYEGDTVAGQKHGRGTHTWNDGRVYSGQYEQGYEHGFGTYTEGGDGDEESSCGPANSATFAAEQRGVGGRKNASSKVKRSTVYTYRGLFCRGERHGYGVQIWPNKQYEGEWVKNIVQGSGTLRWLDTGATYNGEFFQGSYHGHGTYQSGNDGAISKYTGGWKNGRKEGQGRREWSDGRVYEGSFRNNKRHGYGRMTYGDQSVYTGGWENGKRSGQGIELEADGSLRHCGIWEHNQPVDVPGTAIATAAAVLPLARHQKSKDNNNWHTIKLRQNFPL